MFSAWPSFFFGHLAAVATWRFVETYNRCPNRDVVRPLTRFLSERLERETLSVRGVACNPKPLFTIELPRFAVWQIFLVSLAGEPIESFREACAPREEFVYLGLGVASRLVAGLDVGGHGLLGAD